MLAVNERMGARWWLQYAVEGKSIIVQGRWRQDGATIPDDAPCYEIDEINDEIVIGPQRGSMRLTPDPARSTRYDIAVWREGVPDEPETSEPPPPEFDSYAHRVIRELTGEAHWSEYVLPKPSAENLVRQNIDLVDRGRDMGSNHDYVAREIVTRTELKGVTVPRQEGTGPEDSCDEH